jgi:adenosylmethionine-8-amino-7-oxononanoate aminotransferase
MIRTDGSDVFHRFFDLPYPNVERGDGVWLTTVDGRRILDACSGGAMVACLGHGVGELAGSRIGCSD